MLLKIVLLLTLVFYSIVVGQSFMYMLALKQAQMRLDAAPYIKLRKLIDAGMSTNFRWILYGALTCNLVLIITTIEQPALTLVITASIAFVGLIIDVVLAVKGNVPVNNIINSWSADNYPVSWREYRTEWFTIFKYRQIANITGFISLLIGTVFGSAA